MYLRFFQCQGGDNMALNWQQVDDFTRVNQVPFDLSCGEERGAMRVLINTDQYNEAIMTSELTPSEITVIMKALDGARYVKKEGWGKDSRIDYRSGYGEVKIEVVQTCSKLVAELTLRDEVAKVVIEKAHKEEELI